MRMQCSVAVIEDDADIRAVLVEVLTESQMSVETATDPSGLSPSWHGDVILTDAFGLPYRTADAARLVRTLRDRFGAPVVVLSGQPEVIGDGCGAIGADAIVAKPFDVDQLVDVLRGLCLRGLCPRAPALAAAR